MKGDERSWAGRIPLALALTIAMPRLFVPSASAYPVTGGAKVTIGDAIWSSQGCPTATASPQTIPKLTGLCDAITADASAGAYQVCGADHAWIPGESSIDVGKTGCEVDTIVVSPGHKQYRIYNPKRSGQVTVVARVSGQCYDCAPATWTATGIVEVDLEDRDDGCDLCGGPENSSLGSGIVGNNSVDFRLYLGLASPLEKAGFLWVKAEVPSADLARPVWLQLPFGRPNVEVLLGPDKAIKQIKTPQGLVNVAEKDSYEYRLEVFYRSEERRVGKEGGCRRCVE